MISMKNLAKGVLYAVIIILLGVNLYFILSSDSGIGQSFLDEYKANNLRIAEQQRQYDEIQRGVMEAITTLDSGVGELNSRIESLEGGIEDLKGYNRELKDRSVETAILSDRNDRLLKELERRTSEGTEN